MSALNEDAAHPQARSSSRNDSAFERLAVPARSESVPLPDLVPHKKLSIAEEKRSIEHLYTQSIAKKKEKLKRLEDKIFAANSPSQKQIVVGQDSLAEIVGRLYEESRTKKAAEIAKLTAQRHAAVQATKTKVKVFESAEDLSAAVARLYNTIEDERKTSEELFKKYNPSIEVPRRPRSVLEENDARFYKGGFAKHQ
jgi:hypothetical protein